MDSSKQLLGDLLKNVSRSFYTTLRILPRKIRFQIGLAYLLARTSDTIADTELISLESRLQTLEALRSRIAGTANAPMQLRDLAKNQSLESERVLLEKCESSLALLDRLSPIDRKLVRKVLDTITKGQEMDLKRFAGAPKNDPVALVTDAELDDYTYHVAGCVGEFWTDMCWAHVLSRLRPDYEFLMENGVRFGKGLQLVNILRDIAADLRTGRCYVPRDRLAVVGLSPKDLLEPSMEARFRPLYYSYLDQADGHLRAGWAYTNALPRRNVRIRLACAWPILIGFETLKLLRIMNMLDPGHRTKVPRSTIKTIIYQTVLLYPFRKAWSSLGGSAPDS
jgi:farnesyl-diphosphate farnesyltransferase